jgi:hypothetical protein
VSDKPTREKDPPFTRKSLGPAEVAETRVTAWPLALRVTFCPVETVIVEANKIFPEHPKSIVPPLTMAAARADSVQVVRICGEALRIAPG